MRVGLVIYGSLDRTTGGYLYDRMLVAKLREHGDEVRIISLEARPYALSILDNISYKNSLDLDVVLQDELNHPSLMFANRRGLTAPIISIVHHLRSSERRARWKNRVYSLFERLYLDSVDGFIFNSASTRAEVGRLSRRPRPQAVANPGGDRLGSVTQEVVRARAEQDGALRLIFVGSVAPGKGLHDVLDAMALLPRDRVHLEVIGPQDASPHYAARMKQRSASLGLSVHYQGEVSDDQLAAELTRAHALVLPSYHEGFGISLLEGMAHGLPAIASTAGAIPDLVSDGMEGYLVAPGDVGALATRIHALDQDRALLVRLGTAALSKFRSAPTWNETTERIRDFLISLVTREAS